MADVETKETKVASPEKKVVEEVCEKKPVEKKVVEKEVEEVDEDSRASENGAEAAVEEEKESKENGVAKVAVAEEKESESTENGDSTDAPAANDVCSIKRKSTVGLDAPVDAVDGAAPEKKAKLETKPAVEAESNGEEKTAA